MTLLKILPEIDKEHWKLHLNAALDDNPTLKTEIRNLLLSKVDLPNIKHPADIHTWLENPELRPGIEVSSG